MQLKIGQKWARTDGAQFEIEKINKDIIYLRVIKESTRWLLRELAMSYMARQENGWYYLEGQNKP